MGLKTKLITLAGLLLTLALALALLPGDGSQEEQEELKSIVFLPPFVATPTKTESTYLKSVSAITESEAYREFESTYFSKSSQRYEALCSLAGEIDSNSSDKSFTQFLIGFAQFRSAINMEGVLPDWDQIELMVPSDTNGDERLPGWEKIAQTKTFQDLAPFKKQVTLENYLKTTREARLEYGKSHTPAVWSLQKAHQALLRATQLDPGNVLAWYYLARTYRYLALFEEAVEAYESLIKHAPEYSMAYIHLASMHTKSGNQKNAIKLLEKGIDIIPHDSWLVDSMADALIKSDSLAEAKLLLESHIAHLSEAGEDEVPSFVWRTLAEVAEAQGDVSRAASIRDQLND